MKIELTHDDSEKLKLTLHHVRKIQFAEKYSCWKIKLVHDDSEKTKIDITSCYKNTIC